MLQVIQLEIPLSDFRMKEIRDIFSHIDTWVKDENHLGMWKLEDGTIVVVSLDQGGYVFESNQDSTLLQTWFQDLVFELEKKYQIVVKDATKTIELNQLELTREEVMFIQLVEEMISLKKNKVYSCIVDWFVREYKKYMYRLQGRLSHAREFDLNSRMNQQIKYQLNEYMLKDIRFQTSFVLQGTILSVSSNISEDVLHCAQRRCIDQLDVKIHVLRR